MRRSLTWFRSFGVSAVAVSGRESPEFWKPFADPDKYEGRFEELWSESDTTLYRVPLRTSSLAHALPEGSQPMRDWSTVKPYAAALDLERLPGLKLRWDGRNRVLIAGDVQPGEGVSVQINHHAGWQASVSGRSVPIEKDGLGQMWLRPACHGDCSIELTYAGGFELIACRWLSAGTLLAMAVLLPWSLRRRAVIGEA